MINLEKVSKNDEAILHNLMQFYIYEFSKYIPEIKVEQNGFYKRFNLDKYWENDNFHAFFIKNDDDYVGFALIESENEKNPNTINEFFIMAGYKGKGYGKDAATKLFIQYPGNWKVTQIANNYPAQAFWRKLIKLLTNGRAIESYDQKGKSIQEFHTDFINFPTL